ncbi:MAG: hypothetical protein JZU58_21575 [Curvibacter lanceolatus]|uniref:hypothetical protein n=1 Tax=Curvibacter lanceolatus TaxID=86182 RepID=UPI0023546AA4|nr:hypothetical protein [Curvibacter lanceolatus]MBV5294937.1 hypothetical protein [Curvibacter lanceolatus]
MKFLLVAAFSEAAFARGAYGQCRGRDCEGGVLTIALIGLFVGMAVFAVRGISHNARPTVSRCLLYAALSAAIGIVFFAATLRFKLMDDWLGRTCAALVCYGSFYLFIKLKRD